MRHERWFRDVEEEYGQPVDHSPQYLCRVLRLRNVQRNSLNRLGLREGPRFHIFTNIVIQRIFQS
jgi:hypothetical protein